MQISLDSFKINKYFSGFLSCSIGICFFLQTIINIGSIIGILPTKGLTLPIISYGGSSLTVTTIFIFLLLRIDYENRLSKIQAFLKSCYEK